MMQRMGWELAVEFDHTRMAYRIMAHHRQGQLYGYAPDWVHIPPDFASPQHRGFHETERGRLDYFEFQCFANCIEVHNMAEASTMRWQQIDAEPFMINDFKPTRLEDLNVFRVRPHEEEIFVEEADMTVLDHLEAIKALQSDKQREIRQRMLDERRADESTEIITHANIVSLRRAS